MSNAAQLSQTDARRLGRLAAEAGGTPQSILRAVLRDGFEYTEWFVRLVNEGDADLKAGRVMGTEDVRSVIARQRGLRGRKSSAAV